MTDRDHAEKLAEALRASVECKCCRGSLKGSNFHHLKTEALAAYKTSKATHFGKSVEHGGLEKHRGLVDSCVAPDCAPRAPEVCCTDLAGMPIGCGCDDSLPCAECGGSGVGVERRYTETYVPCPRGCKGGES